MSVELLIKNVCLSAYSELRRISKGRHLLSVKLQNTCVRLCPFEARLLYLAPLRLL